MSVDGLLEWIKATPVSEAIAESDWLFPSIESVHVIALTLVVGSIAIVDLRLLNLASRSRPVREVIAAILPLTWAAFALSVVTGLTLFVAKPVVYGHNGFFLVKLGLIALAGLNMGAFHLFIDRTLPSPASLDPASRLAKASALASLGLWIGVVTCGRWIGFTI